MFIKVTTEVARERDGQVLGAMKNTRIRASTEEIAKSLQGNWRAEHRGGPARLNTSLG
jgi:hypothetical protein